MLFFFFFESQWVTVVNKTTKSLGSLESSDGSVRQKAININ